MDIDDTKDTRFTRLTLMVLLVLAPLVLGAADGKGGPLKIADDLVVTELEFGYLDESTGRIVASNVIPVSSHSSFGWRMVLDTPRTEVTFREEFILPGPSRAWQVGPETRVSPDRRVAITEATRKLERDGTLVQAWRYAPGDPSGQYETRVWIEGRRVADFRYEVRK